MIVEKRSVPTIFIDLDKEDANLVRFINDDEAVQIEMSVDKAEQLSAKLNQVVGEKG